MITTAVFYLFAFILTVSALSVITARNPVHAVLFLVLAFFNAAGLFIMQGAEFLGLILAIVYVGAVAVLFLFVVMMLDVDFTSLRAGAMKYVPLGMLLGAVLLVEFATLLGNWNIIVPEPQASAVGNISNTHALGYVLYTDYVVAFQLAGLVLLVAMIGAIVLTHRRRPGVRRQKIHEQVTRAPNDVLTIQKVESGKGVTL